MLDNFHDLGSQTIKSDNLRQYTWNISYRKGRDNIAEAFYIPCFARSVHYDRAVAYFRSTVFILVWSQMRDFIRRDGRIRLLCSPNLEHSDMIAMLTGQERLVEKCQNWLDSELDFLFKEKDLADSARALAALIGLGYIEVRLLVFSDSCSEHSHILFHDKLGIFRDSHENRIVFKGSMNESYQGLAADGNLESVDVFLSWESERELNRVIKEEEYFEELWVGKYPGIATVTPSRSWKEKLENLMSHDEMNSLLSDLCKLEIENRKTHLTNVGKKSYELRPHQAQAIKSWKENDRRGILEHATGSGKTVTALTMIKDAIQHGETPLVLVPSRILLNQWKNEIKQHIDLFEVPLLVCGAGNNEWREKALLNPWSRPSRMGQGRIILSTMQTSVTKAFRHQINDGSHLFLVADEVHRMGSTKLCDLFSLEVGPRIGLSATPKRQGDTKGSEQILSFFGGILDPVYQLEDAIADGILSKYIYRIHKTTLNVAEAEQWALLTKRISKLCNINLQSLDSIHDDEIKLLLIKRSRIVKQAESKPLLANNILATQYKEGERWIVYCDDLRQLEIVFELTKSNNLPVFKYYSNMQGSKEAAIAKFRSVGGIIVSIRCLDEGVDIPEVSHALILASSQNKREFIQRRGRVLRKVASLAQIAHIYDVLVLPPDQGETASFLRGELSRAWLFAKGAMNSAVCEAEIKSIAFNAKLSTEEFCEEGFEDD